MSKNRRQIIIITALAAVILITILLFMINYSKEVERSHGIVISAIATEASDNPDYDYSAYPDYYEQMKDINKVKQEELARIKGIGRTLAYNIVSYREENGGFTSMSQLKEVYGMTEEAYLMLLENFVVR